VTGHWEEKKKKKTKKKVDKTPTVHFLPPFAAALHGTAALCDAQQAADHHSISNASASRYRASATATPPLQQSTLPRLRRRASAPVNSPRHPCSPR